MNKQHTYRATVEWTGNLGSGTSSYTAYSRDYSKTNPEWVQGFIDRYRHKMVKLSLREAGKYLPPKAT